MIVKHACQFIEGYYGSQFSSFIMECIFVDFFQGEAVTPSYANEVTKLKPTFGFGRIFPGGIQTSSTERATIGKLNFTFFQKTTRSEVTIFFPIHEQ